MNLSEEKKECLKRSANYMVEEFMKRILIKQYIREQEKEGATFIFKLRTDGQYRLEELKIGGISE